MIRLLLTRGLCGSFCLLFNKALIVRFFGQTKRMLNQQPLKTPRQWPWGKQGHPFAFETVVLTGGGIAQRQPEKQKTLNILISREEDGYLFVLPMLVIFLGLRSDSCSLLLSALVKEF